MPNHEFSLSEIPRRIMLMDPLQQRDEDAYRVKQDDTHH
jgi:hypothetical protein